MIDYDLVDSNVAHCLIQLEKKTTTGIDNLYCLCNFFTTDLIKKLLSYAESAQNWQKVELQENKNRLAVTWDPDTVVEECHMIFNQLSDYLNHEFKKKCQLTGIQLWKDLPGYHISSHVDNNRVIYSMQIYLSTGVDQLGTCFYDNNVTVEIPYQINSGYVTDAGQTISHGLPRQVSADHVRYSIYAVWA
mgnify:CR=1 FL=1